MPRTEVWRRWPVRGTDAVEITGVLVGSDAAPEGTVVCRVRFEDAAGKAVETSDQALKWSEAAGHYFYPQQISEDFTFRFMLEAPRSAAALKICVQHWKKAVKDDFYLLRFSVQSGDRQDKSLAKREKLLGRHARELLTIVLSESDKPLYPPDAPLSEGLLENFILRSNSNIWGRRLAQRRLAAGRSQDALRLQAVVSNSQLLDREAGRIELLSWAGQLETPQRPPVIKSRRVLYLLQNCQPYNSGGYASRAHGLLKGFRNAGWDVSAIARLGYPGDRKKSLQADEETVDGMAYRFLPGTASIDQKDQVHYVEAYADRVLQVIGKAKIGYVQAASFFQNGFAGRLIANELKVPLVYEMRGLEWFSRGAKTPQWVGTEQSLLLRDLELEAAKCADHVFAITQALKDWLVQEGIGSQRISILPNGCYPEDLSSVPTEGNVRESLGLEPDCFVLGYIGTVTHYEGLENVVYAVRMARDRSGKNIKFLLVGDGISVQDLRNAMKEHRGDDFVIMTGRVPHQEVRKYYSAMDCLILARRNLPICNVISPMKPLEAMGFGRPVITSDVAAIKEIIEASGGGFLFKADDREDMVEAILRVAGDRDLVDAAGEKGQAWVKSLRTWDSIAGRAMQDLVDRFGCEETGDFGQWRKAQ